VGTANVGGEDASNRDVQLIAAGGPVVGKKIQAVSLSNGRW
jgi:hypothetical protein